MGFGDVFSVAIRVADDAGLPRLMQTMRIWLDKQKIEPSTFRSEFLGSGASVLIDFKVEAEAAEFARVVNGEMLEKSRSGGRINAKADLFLLWSAR